MGCAKAVWYVWLMPTMILLALFFSLTLGCVFLDVIDGLPFSAAWTAFTGSPMNNIVDRFRDLWSQVPFVEIFIGIKEHNKDHFFYRVFSDISQSALITFVTLILSRLNRLFTFSGKVVGVSSPFSFANVLFNCFKIISLFSVTVLFCWLESLIGFGTVPMWCVCVIILAVSIGAVFLINIFFAQTPLGFVLVCISSLIDLISSALDALAVGGVVALFIFFFSGVNSSGDKTGTFAFLLMFLSMFLYFLLKVLIDQISDKIKSALLLKYSPLKLT